jgi:Cu/Ag efflux protein CusF/lysophospholipase L1-like esterase
MIRTLGCTIALALGGLVALAQNDIQKGKIKKVDADKGTVTVAAGGGKDVELTVMENTRFMGADGNMIKDGLGHKGFKEGALVMFKVVNQGDKALLVGVRLVGPGAAGQPIPKVDTSKLKPLTEMGTEVYQGYKGGLYPGGKNQRPAAHEKAGLSLAKGVQPLDADGKPHADGKIVLLSVGMSNTTQVFSAFKRLADADAAKNRRLVIVDGAQGGMTALRIQDPENPKGGAQFWSTVDKRLETAGVSRAQVQAVWIKEADAGPTQGFPKYAQTLQAELAKIVQLFPKRFPNVKLAYLSSRTYGGYAKTPLNPDPYAFESGFSVKWLIEDQIKGEPGLNYDAAKGSVTAPWLSWGPYLWANGTTKRADGFFYEESDFGSDGTHPSPAGQQKVARLLLDFFKNDSTTKGWFTK